MSAKETRVAPESVFSPEPYLPSYHDSGIGHIQHFVVLDGDISLALHPNSRWLHHVDEASGVDNGVLNHDVGGVLVQANAIASTIRGPFELTNRHAQGQPDFNLLSICVPS